MNWKVFWYSTLVFEGLMAMIALFANKMRLLVKGDEVLGQVHRGDFRKCLVFTRHAGLLLDIFCMSPLLASAMGLYSDQWVDMETLLASALMGFIITLFANLNWVNQSYETYDF